MGHCERSNEGDCVIFWRSTFAVKVTVWLDLPNRLPRPELVLPLVLLLVLLELEVPEVVSVALLPVPPWLLGVSNCHGSACILPLTLTTANSIRPDCGFTIRSSICPRSCPSWALTLAFITCLLARKGWLELLLMAPEDRPVALRPECELDDWPEVPYWLEPDRLLGSVLVELPLDRPDWLLPLV